MGDGFDFFDIIIFAMLAGYLVFQLRRVLGRKTGHERRPPAPGQQAGRSDSNVIPLPDDRSVKPDPAQSTESDPDMSPLTRLKAMDPDYDEREFLRGARSAFEWIVTAFARGDRDQLAGLLSPSLLARFTDAIDRREAAGETLETTVSAVRSAMIETVDLNETVVTITVEFISDQIKTLRDAEGAVIDGNPDQFETLTDIWSFRRDIRSGDPNWQLVETRVPDD